MNSIVYYFKKVFYFIFRIKGYDFDKRLIYFAIVSRDFNKNRYSIRNSWNLDKELGKNNYIRNNLEKVCSITGFSKKQLINFEDYSHTCTAFEHVFGKDSAAYKEAINNYQNYLNKISEEINYEKNK